EQRATAVGNRVIKQSVRWLETQCSLRKTRVFSQFASAGKSSRRQSGAQCRNGPNRRGHRLNRHSSKSRRPEPRLIWKLGSASRQRKSESLLSGRSRKLSRLGGTLSRREPRL